MSKSNLHKASWIWLDAGTNQVNQYVDFLIPFNYTEDSSLSLSISADSNYSVWVNNNFVPCSQYADYPFYKVYDELDITAFAKKGENILAITGYCQNEDSHVYYKGNPAISFCLESNGEIIEKSSTKTLCRKAVDYASGMVEKISPQLSFSFRYDSRLYDKWRGPDYTTGKEWVSAKEVQGSKDLFARPVKLLNFLNPVSALLQSSGFFSDTQSESAPCGDRAYKAYLSVMEPPPSPGGLHSVNSFPSQNGVEFAAEEGDGIYIVLDLKREEAGLLSIDLALPQDAEILISWGEHLSNMRVNAGSGNQFCGVYYGRSGRQKFTHRFKRIAGRYLQLHIYSKKVTLYYAGIIPTEYPVKYLEEPNIPDRLHRKIFEVSRRTLELCMHEHYEDCPWREQALYGFDSAIQMMCGYYVFDGFSFAEASLRLLALGLRSDDLLEMCAPARCGGTIPSFSLHVIIAAYENVLRSKNKAFAAEFLYYADRILSVFTNRMGENGLASSLPGYWNFYEWSDGLDGNPNLTDDDPVLYEATLNAILSMALSACAGLHDICGSLKGKHYEKIAQEINVSLQIFWNNESQIFLSSVGQNPEDKCHELTQALIVCCGAANAAQREAVLKKMSKGTKSGLVPATLSSHFYKYSAFMTEPEKYGKWVENDIAKIWGEMLFDGATSFWEIEEGATAFGGGGSLCHGWSSIPAYFYSKYNSYLFS